MTPYYEDNYITLYCADSREALLELRGQYDVVLTDPPWPTKTTIPIVGWERAPELLAEVAGSIDPTCERLIFIFGDQSDPRILTGVPKHFPFLRTCFMRRTPPPYRGNILGIGDMAHIFGKSYLVDNGKKLLTGMCEIQSDQRDRERSKRSGHPCPRNIRGIEWLVARYTRTTDRIVDPFAGVGTTLMAAKYGGRKCIGIEIEERWCEAAAKELRQAVFSF